MTGSLSLNIKTHDFCGQGRTMRSLLLCMAGWDSRPGGNDMFSFGLKALPEYGAALRSRPEQIGSALQTGFTQ
jgi:hypothetical protein